MIRLILCDDQAIVTEGLQVILGAVSDFEIVATAHDGAEAVDLVAEHQPDIVLMDLQLPGINGYDATRVIKKTRPDLPVILVTANAIEKEKMKSEEAGCDGFITKPIDINQLATTVSKLLSRA